MFMYMFMSACVCLYVCVYLFVFCSCFSTSSPFSATFPDLIVVAFTVSINENRHYIFHKQLLLSNLQDPYYDVQ